MDGIDGFELFLCGLFCVVAFAAGWLVALVIERQTESKEQG